MSPRPTSEACSTWLVRGQSSYRTPDKKYRDGSKDAGYRTGWSEQPEAYVLAVDAQHAIESYERFVRSAMPSDRTDVRVRVLSVVQAPDTLVIIDREVVAP